MTRSPQGQTNASALERFAGKVRELRYEVDWLKVAILTVIGACAFAIFLIVVFIGQYRVPH